MTTAAKEGMTMTEEGFFSAAGPREAYDLLAKYGDDARLLAGGTDVMVAVNKRTFTPRVLIYIGDAGLNYIKHEGEDVLIGAATPFTDILKSSLVAQNLPFLKEVVSHIASPAIRNAGTIGAQSGHIISGRGFRHSIAGPWCELETGIEKTGKEVLPWRTSSPVPGRMLYRAGR